MSERSLILFFSSKDENDVQITERIRETLENEHIRVQQFDISQKYTLYGHTFTYENSFVNDYFENGYTDYFITPLLRAGKEIFMGEESINRNIPYLKAKYGR